MQRKEWTAAHDGHRQKDREALMRTDGLEYLRAGGGISLTEKQRFAGTRSGGPRGSTHLELASHSAQLDDSVETQSAWSSSPGAPRATLAHSGLGS